MNRSREEMLAEALNDLQGRIARQSWSADDNRWGGLVKGTLVPIITAALRTLARAKCQEEDRSMTDRYGEAVSAAVESDGVQTTRKIKDELGIGYNDAARFTERMVADGILSEPDPVGRRTLIRNFVGCCEPCGAPLFENDDCASDDNGCLACIPAFYDDAAKPGNYACYAERVGGIEAHPTPEVPGESE